MENEVLNTDKVSMRRRKCLQENLFQGFGDEGDSAKPGKTKIHHVLEGEKGDEIKQMKSELCLSFDDVIQLPSYWSKPKTETAKVCTDSGNLSNELRNVNAEKNNWEVEACADDETIKGKSALEATEENYKIIANYSKWNVQVVRNKEVLTKYSELLNLPQLMSAAEDPNFSVNIINIWGALVVADMLNNNERKQQCLQFIKRNPVEVLEDDPKTMFVSVGLYQLFLEVKCFVLNRHYSVKCPLVERVYIARAMPQKKEWTSPKIVYCFITALTFAAVYLTSMGDCLNQVVPDETLLQ